VTAFVEQVALGALTS
jgi:regulator of replication initiation timing